MAATGRMIDNARQAIFPFFGRDDWIKAAKTIPESGTYNHTHHILVDTDMYRTEFTATEHSILSEFRVLLISFAIISGLVGLLIGILHATNSKNKERTDVEESQTEKNDDFNFDVDVNYFKRRHSIGSESSSAILSRKNLCTVTSMKEKVLRTKSYDIQKLPGRLPTAKRITRKDLYDIL